MYIISFSLNILMVKHVSLETAKKQMEQMIGDGGSNREEKPLCLRVS